MRRNLPRSAADSVHGKAVQNNGGSEIIVLGVDPGTLTTGYGVIVRRKSGIRFLSCGAIHNESSLSMALRLKKIYSGLNDIISRFQPDEFAIESAFYGKNAQSALKLGHARGVCMLAAVEHEIPTTEYSPREVKKAVVGNGSGSKEQVQYMVRSMLSLADRKMLHDSSDALAVAICHLHRLTAPTAKHKDWKSFVASNPHRVIA